MNCFKPRMCGVTQLADVRVSGVVGSTPTSTLFKEVCNAEVRVQWYD